MKKMYRMILSILLLLSAAVLTACRVRITTGGTASIAGAVSGGESGSESEDSGGDPEISEEAEGNGETVENPESERREFDESAVVEITGGTDRLIHGEGEGDGTPADEEDDRDGAVIKLNDEAEEDALLTVSAEEAERTGVSDEGETAESVLEYYTVLLEDRGRSLMECKRLYVYWETAADHVTVYRSSPEHELILSAGSYDVSARLTEDRLNVDDGWVVRKNPGIIVKVVGSDILGSSVTSADAAEALREGLTAREGWAGIDALRQERVLLLSEELLTEPWLRTAAALVLAKTAVPDLYADIDPEEALRRLTEEATGSAASGIFWLGLPE